MVGPAFPSHNPADLRKQYFPAQLWSFNPSYFPTVPPGQTQDWQKSGGNFHPPGNYRSHNYQHKTCVVEPQPAASSPIWSGRVWDVIILLNTILAIHFIDTQQRPNTAQDQSSYQEPAGRSNVVKISVQWLTAGEPTAHMAKQILDWRFLFTMQDVHMGHF